MIIFQGVKIQEFSLALVITYNTQNIYISNYYSHEATHKQALMVIWCTITVNQSKSDRTSSCRFWEFNAHSRSGFSGPNGVFVLIMQSSPPGLFATSTTTNFVN